MPVPQFATWNRIASNVDILCRLFGSSEKDCSRSSYLRVLQSLQENVFPGINEPEPVVVFDASQAGINKLALRFAESCTGDQSAFRIFEHGEQERITIGIRSGCEILHTHIPDMHTSINVLIGCFLCLKINGSESGTWKNTLGVVMINPKKKWNDVQFCETIFHEFVHQAFYLEEMIHGIFSEQALNTGSSPLAMSAIRKCPRPFVQALHSAVVALSLSHLYGVLQRSTDEQYYRESARTSLSDIHGHRHLLTKHGKSILAELILLAET